MTESSLKLIHTKLKQDYPTYALSSSFISHLTSTPGAMQLSTAYSLYLIDKKDFRTLSSLLPAIASAYTESDTDLFPDGYMHSIVVGLCSHISVMRDAILQSLIKEFFLPCARHSETCLLYLCRFLWVGCSKMKREVVHDTLDDMRPATDQVCVCNAWVDAVWWLTFIVCPPLYSGESHGTRSISRTGW